MAEARASDRAPAGSAELAVSLALVTKRLAARLREQFAASQNEVSLSQLALLARLQHDGPQTAAALAAAEHISGQAVAQTLAPLRAAGLISSQPHPSDGRKTLIAATAEVDALWVRVLDSRNAWLLEVLQATLGEDEWEQLADAVALLERIAETAT